VGSDRRTAGPGLALRALWMGSKAICPAISVIGSKRTSVTTSLNLSTLGSAFVQGRSRSQQASAQLSLIWWPVPQVRVLFNFARLAYQDAAVAIAGVRNYGVNAFGTRFQIAF
jgi:hypothetical protein